MKRLLTTKEAAEILNINIRTLDLWRRKKQGPPYVQIGRKIQYEQETLQQWIKEKETTNETFAD